MVALRVFLVALGAMLASPALAQRVLDRMCIAELLKAPAFPGGKPIPIGCELIDCCPGCPATGSIEWDIRIEGDAFAGAQLSFEGLSASELARVRIAGRRLERSRAVLRPGTTRVKGLPSPSGEQVGVGVLRPIIDKRAVAEIAKKGARAIERISVRQFLGAFAVNDFDWRIWLRPCQRPPVPPLRLEDRLRIQGLAPGEDAAVIMDARKATGCHDGSAGASSEWVFGSSGSNAFENLRVPGTCNSEIAVFSANHAVHLESVTTWTDAPGDVHTVTLQPLKDVDVHLWVMDDATAATAHQHIAIARDLYIENRVGVRFVPTVRKLADVTTDSNPGSVVDGGISVSGSHCLALPPIQAKPYYTPNTLNVYYVNKPFRGRNCATKATPTDCLLDPVLHPPGDANIIFIGSGAATTSLAHEIGHAYGLRPAWCDGHTENVVGIPADNLMNALGGDERSTLTLGQVFRMHTHADPWGGTMLIRNNYPTRVGRTCMPNLFSATCPALTVDWP